MNLLINGQAHAVALEWQDETLLDVLREHLGLVGSKFGCGAGLCGACSVLVDGTLQRACLLPVSSLGSRAITTVEGLARDGQWHPVQQAWLAEKVPQCGYCQAGQMMCSVALLRAVPKPTDAQIDEAMAGQLCRCGTQARIRRAVHRAAAA
jgi:isoquinoline 1-oxidoreductase alpha subunit